jgi:hypothetical protein
LRSSTPWQAAAIVGNVASDFSDQVTESQLLETAVKDLSVLVCAVAADAHAIRHTVDNVVSVFVLMSSASCYVAARQRGSLLYVHDSGSSIRERGATSALHTYCCCNRRTAHSRSCPRFGFA